MQQVLPSAASKAMLARELLGEDYGLPKCGPCRTMDMVTASGLEALRAETAR